MLWFRLEYGPAGASSQDDAVPLPAAGCSRPVRAPFWEACASVRLREGERAIDGETDRLIDG